MTEEMGNISWGMETQRKKSKENTRNQKVWQKWRETSDELIKEISVNLKIGEQKPPTQEHKVKK